MERLNLGYIYTVCERLHPLTELRGEKTIVDIFFHVITSRSVLEELFSANFYNLKSSRASADRLYGLLTPYANPDPNSFGNKIEEWQINAIAESAKAFEIALNGELGILPSYLITPKGGYNIDTLIFSAHNLFPSDLLTLVPEVKYDVEQAGKCLAYEVPTAAGFHLHRINEAVLRVYWDVVTNKALHPKERNMGVYLRELKRKKKGDRKIKATLQQIKDLDRNPILHPDKHLTIDDAIELNGIIVSSVSRMLFVIRKQRIVS